MFENKWRKLGKHLDKHGTRAPATVVEIAKSGREVRSEGFGPLDAIRDLSGDKGTPLAPNSSHYSVRRARLRIRPADDPEFEVERDMRFGDYGRYVPKAGEEIEVVYDPDNHEKVMVAPPTAEEEQLRAAVALGKADVGFTVNGGGQRGGGEPPSEEQLAQQRQAMEQSHSMLEMAQQFMSGQTKPGEMPSEGSGEDDEEKKNRG
jgi:hypothetical protein